MSSPVNPPNSNKRTFDEVNNKTNDNEDNNNNITINDSMDDNELINNNNSNSNDNEGFKRMRYSTINCPMCDILVDYNELQYHVSNQCAIVNETRRSMSQAGKLQPNNNSTDIVKKPINTID